MIIDEATADLTEHIHEMLKSQMADELEMKNVDLTSLSRSFDALFQAGFGAYTVANLGEAAVNIARNRKSFTAHASLNGAVQ